MEDLLHIETPPSHKVYTDSAAAMAAFFGGPLAAAFVIGQNYLIFGKRRQAIITWIVGAIVMCCYLGFIILISLDKIPTLLLLAILAIVSRHIVGSYQSKEVADHIERRGWLYPMWRVAAFSLLFSIVVYGIQKVILKLIDGSFSF